MKIYTRQLKRAALAAFAATAFALGPALLSPAAAAGPYPFIAIDSGAFRVTSCVPPTPCTVTLNGTGGASYLGKTTESASLQVSIKIPCSPTSGTATLAEAKSPTKAITATVTGTICVQNPITAGLKINFNYTFPGGHGVITGTAVLKAGTYTDHWKGCVAC